MTHPVVIDARDGFAPQPRGWGRYARCLVDALNSLTAAELGLPGLEVITTAARGPEVVFEQVRLPWLLRRRAAVLVHATDCFLPLVRPCPGVVTIHDLAFEHLRDELPARTGLKYRTLTARAARSAERIICPSGYTRDDVCQRYGVNPEKVRIIPEAPALPSATTATATATGSRPGSGDRPYILAVGDLRRKKNLRALVGAFAQLWRDGAGEYRLVLAGVDAGEGPELQALAGRAPIQRTGYASDGDLDALIRGAELVVHPSVFEGFGLVVLEAMSRGTPVLAARAGALPETGGEAAAYFDPDDPGSLLERLRAVLADGATRAQLSRAGRAWAAQFSWERTARETAAVYRELL